MKSQLKPLGEYLELDVFFLLFVFCQQSLSEAGMTTRTVVLCGNCFHV